MVGENELEDLVLTLQTARHIPCEESWDIVYRTFDAYLAKKKESERGTITCPYCQTVIVLSKGTTDVKCACRVRWEKVDSLPVPLPPFDGIGTNTNLCKVAVENRDKINEIIRALALHFGKEDK